jgi:Mce-associated membrane protein
MVAQPTLEREMTSAQPGRARLPLLLVVVLVALLAASLVLWLGQRRSLDQGAAVAARQEALNFFGLDYRHADQDLDAVLSLATGDFKSEYAAKRDQLAKSLADKKVVMTAEVPSDGTALEFETDSAATVLVAVDVTTNAVTNRYRARIDLTKVDGTWLVSGVDQVG